MGSVDAKEREVVHVVDIEMAAVLVHAPLVKLLGCC